MYISICSYNIFGIFEAEKGQFRPENEMRFFSNAFGEKPNFAPFKLCVGPSALFPSIALPCCREKLRNTFVIAFLEVIYQKWTQERNAGEVERNGFWLTLWRRTISHFLLSITFCLPPLYYFLMTYNIFIINTLYISSPVPQIYSFRKCTRKWAQQSRRRVSILHSFAVNFIMQYYHIYSLISII